MSLIFSTKQLELIADLGLGNDLDPEVKDYFIQELGRLEQALKDGGDEVARDLRKAETIRNMILQLKQEEKQESAKTAFEQFLAWLDKKTRTNVVYDSLGWFTSVRLFMLRANRLLGLLIPVFAEFIAKPLIQRVFAIAGLSYGLELIADIGVIAYSLLRPSAKAEKGSSEKNKFTRILTKDNRPARMANAAVWFGSNFSLFMLATLGIMSFGTPVTLALCLGAFTFDVFHEAYKGWKNYKKYNELGKKVGKDLTEKREALRKLPDTEENKAQRAELQREIKILETLVPKIEEKKSAIIKKHAYITACTFGILVGMALFFIFPPLGILAAPLAIAGAATALVAGSILIGLGKRLWDKASGLFESDKPTIDPIQPPGPPPPVNGPAIQPIVFPPAQQPVPQEAPSIPRVIVTQPIPTVTATQPEPIPTVPAHLSFHKPATSPRDPSHMPTPATSPRLGSQE